MAASALLVIGDQPQLLQSIVDKAKILTAGKGAGQMGPVINDMSLKKIIQYIDESEKGGAKILLDGRGWSKEQTSGYWIGPTVILHSNKQDKALHDEIFGPVLSIYQCQHADEAIQIQNESPYGNAACIYTTTGATAEYFSKRFSSGMIGVNIGVPVPREPFSFGGFRASKFGDADITGDGGVEFFTQRRKITTKWSIPKEKSWLS
jgi:acyl-CoA reductase-like NAD-dependent aldehyde dehydrogenase